LKKFDEIQIEEDDKQELDIELILLDNLILSESFVGKRF
jgi:hypothetical protein